MSGANQFLRETLLQAAFAPREAALLAWQRWERDSGWQDHVEFDSYLLLPRVYHNLGSGSVEDALFRRLKGIIRQNWAANTRRLAMLKALAGRSSLPVKRLLVLPPLSLLRHDRSTALSNECAAVWLPQKGDLAVFAADLREGGWLTPNRRIPDWCLRGFVAAASSMTWEHVEYGALEVHWPCSTSGIHPGWQPRNSGVETTLADTPLYCLGPDDTVRYLLLAPGLGPAFRRCGRAMLYLQQTGERQGWQRLLQLLRISSSPLLETVLALAPSTVESAVDECIDAGHPFPAPDGERRLPFFRKQWQHWNNFYSDLGEETRMMQALGALPGYLMGKWNLNHPSEIPRRLLLGLLSDFRYRN